MKYIDFNFEVHFKTGSPIFITGDCPQGTSLTADFENYLKSGNPKFGRYNFVAEKSTSELVIAFEDVRAVHRFEPKQK